jgi:pilus assembly protein CpaE
MVKANEKLAVLSAEAPLNQPLLSDGSAFYQLQEELRTAFECTVIDLPRHMVVQHPHLVAEVHSTVVVGELTLASARDMIRVISWLKSNAPQTNVTVVINRYGVGGTSELSRKEFESSIERKVDFVIPFDAKVATQAAKLGKPVSEAGKGSKTVQALTEMARKILAVTDGEEAADSPAKESKSLMGKFGDFRALLPKKDKEKPNAKAKVVNA